MRVRVDCKMAQENFGGGDDENVLDANYGRLDTNVYICQNSFDHTLKIDILYHVLYI